MGMSKSQQNSMALDPKRAMIAKEMSVMPGGPENNNPDPVIQAGAGVNPGTSIYNDYDQTGVYPAMNGSLLNPDMVKNSMVPGYLAPGQRLNAGYGQYQQPDINGNSPMADAMESSRYMMRMDPELPQSAMGLTGSAAIPGGLPPDMPGTTGQPLMPGSPGMANPGMIPGSTPQKVGKKKGGKK